MYKVYGRKSDIFLAIHKATKMHPVISKFYFPRFTLTFVVIVGASI